MYDVCVLGNMYVHVYVGMCVCLVNTSHCIDNETRLTYASTVLT